jgi:two-component system chemotaxis response regulator CheY
MKTLIVEDDFTSRLILQQIFSPYGECHMAMNGKEAIDAFIIATKEGAPYDLICLDLMMPEMNGRDALKRIRKLENEFGIKESDEVKILMLSMMKDSQRVDDICREGATAYMVKPIVKEVLLKHLTDFGLP